MRKKFYFAAILAGLVAFTGCSEDSNIANGGLGDSMKKTGFVKLSLNLPSTPSSTFRAANDVFDDGLPAEYQVNDVILALFYGADEASAVCQWAGKLPNQFAQSPSENVTTTSVKVQEVPNPADENTKVFALAIVNPSGYFSVSEDSKLIYDAAGAAGTTVQTVFSGTLAKLHETASAVDINKIANAGTSANFMMTNAPISDLPGSSAGQKITTLVPLNIYDDEPSAENATPDKIYVERVAAKVSLTTNTPDNTFDISNPETPNLNGAKIKVLGWTLQNTNKKTYLVRNMGTGWTNWIGYKANGTTRFIGTTPNPFRTYWGEDPNYNKVELASISENFNVYDNPDDLTWTDVSTAQTPTAAYCAENTTSTTAMLKNQLTAVLIKTQFDIDGDGTAEDFFTVNNTSAVFTKESIQDALAAVLNNLTGTDKLQDGESIQVKTGLTEGLIATDETGVQNMFEVKTATSTKALTTTQAQAILNRYQQINYYQDGVTFYYTTLIKHFGDDVTPVTKIEDISDYTEIDHLGRFGVLRNNWYELNITSITGPGEPQIPEIPEEPGDKNHSYVQAEVNILSWAKRVQNIDL